MATKEHKELLRQEVLRRRLAKYRIAHEFSEFETQLNQVRQWNTIYLLYFMYWQMRNWCSNLAHLKAQRPRLTVPAGIKL